MPQVWRREKQEITGTICEATGRRPLFAINRSETIKAMTSINPHVTALLEAYNSAMGIEMIMAMSFECWLLNAHNAGLTPDDFKLAIKARLKFNAKGGFERGVMLHHFVRSEEDIAVTLNEAAVIRASMRIKVVEPAKASVLRATHRPDTVPETEAKHISAIPLIAELRKAAK